MRSRRITRTIALAAALAAGTGRAEQPAPAGPAADASAARARAERAAARLGQELIGRLREALAEGPPEQAVQVCADLAQRLTAEVAAAEGVDLRRVALRRRNPANDPDPFERQVLEGWARSPAPPEAVAEVTATAGGGRELRYLRPISTVALCRTCHGDGEAMTAELRAAIARRYPNDRATGFAEGDLRGAVSVRVPLAPTGPAPAPTADAAAPSP
jgi:hypothetical protein